MAMLGNANNKVPFRDHNKHDPATLSNAGDYDHERGYNKNDPATLAKLIAYLSKDQASG
jgi:hypothetical protein